MPDVMNVSHASLFKQISSVICRQVCREKHLLQMRKITDSTCAVIYLMDMMTFLMIHHIHVFVFVFNVGQLIV